MSEEKQDLEIVGVQLLEAANIYWEIMRKHGLHGGCIWLTAKDGNMVVFTRGEYREQLLKNITTQYDEGRVFQFGSASHDRTS